MPEVRPGIHTIRSHGTKVARIHISDWLILLLLVIIDAILNLIEPFHRFVGEGMMADLRYPLKDNTIPFWAVPLVAILLPIAVFLVYYFIRKDVYDFHHAILGILFSILITAVITDAIKDGVGRPRPDFFWRCFPDGKGTYNRDGSLKSKPKILPLYSHRPMEKEKWVQMQVDGNVVKNCVLSIGAFIKSYVRDISVYANSHGFLAHIALDAHMVSVQYAIRNHEVFDQVTRDVRCTGDKSVIKEGHKSFPSGHTSWSFAGLGFLAWYLSGKIRAFDRRGHVAKLCIVFLPLLVAAMIAVSRVDDYWHHWQDVFAGGIIGLTVASFCYLQFFPPPYDVDGWGPHAYFQMLAESRNGTQTSANNDSFCPQPAELQTVSVYIPPQHDVDTARVNR
ncbi:Phosphatidic acid phosphatase type 2/haloperoxidase [Sesbania bispinosa]|nr:Phosphatidic acid phosphatase type 2/haloperoxidase [Sesbania bispinosa]